MIWNVLMVQSKYPCIHSAEISYEPDQQWDADHMDADIDFVAVVRAIEDELLRYTMADHEYKNRSES